MVDLIVSERPSPVSNCSVFNQTSESVELNCDEGHDGGLPQHFVLEVYETEMSEMRYNVSSNSASFHLGNLSPSNGFKVILYSVNAKGRSEPFHIHNLVLRQSQKFKGTFHTFEIIEIEVRELLSEKSLGNGWN